MRAMSSVAKVHIIEGRPWKDALISVLEPRSLQRTWHATGGGTGDVVIAVLDTDPQSVLAAVGIEAPDGEVGDAIAASSRFYLNGLLGIGKLNMLADFKVTCGLSGGWSWGTG